MTFEQRCDGSEGRNHVGIWKEFQEEDAISIGALNSKESDVSGVE
jgi:hypothetical protein